MKKAKLLVAALAFISGVGGAVAVKATAKPAILHDWMDWSGQTILYGMTQAQAQEYCSPSIDVCLRAKDNVFIYTTGNMPW
jgi:hypothetical protein